jgi:aspartyl-tRNA(Asn)/glutamyl-tRNA(Gln) amidotransferase subunit A
VDRAWSESRETLARAGHRVIEIPVTETVEIRSLIRLIMRTEAAAVHRELMRRQPANYPVSVRKFISGGEGVLGVDYVDALRLRGPLLARALETTFSKIDALLTPTVPVLAPRYDDIADPKDPGVWRTVTLLAHYTQPASYLGLPALSAPFTLSADGLPIGMQLIGAPWAEATLFRAAAPLQRHWQSLDVWPDGTP